MANEYEKHECKKHGSGHEQQCCGQQRPMQRFMEAGLLLLLAQKDSHGYYLAEQLAKFGIENINVSTLYRIMHRMEEQGWVCSSWQKGAQGPQKRVYSITKPGLEALCEWIEIFKQRRQSIDLLLSEYDRHTSQTEE